MELHTWLLDNGALVQSGKGWKKAAWAVETEANTARLQESMVDQPTGSVLFGSVSEAPPEKSRTRLHGGWSWGYDID